MFIDVDLDIKFTGIGRFHVSDDCCVLYFSLVFDEEDWWVFLCGDLGELVLWGSNGIPWDRVHHNLLKILIQKPNLVNLDQKPIHISRNIELNIKEFLRISQSSKIHHFISNPYKQFSSHHKNRHNISVHCREKRR